MTTVEKIQSEFSDRNWSEKTFEELFSFLITGTKSRSDLSPYGDIGYIHYGDIHAKWNLIVNCDNEEIPKISKKKVKNLPLLKEGDLILADASEDYVGIGACILLKNIKNKKIVSGLHTILLRSDNTKISFDYSAYLTSIKKVKDQLVSIATGTSVYGLSKNKIKKVKVYLPNDVTEQSLIAKIISDIDELIVQLNHIITKKKNIKQGTMQEILTGNKRLKGFSGKWETEFLEKIGEISGAGVDKKIKSGETPVRLVNYLDVYNWDFIYSKYQNHHVTASALQAFRCEVKQGDVFFTPSSEIRTDIGVSAIAMEDIPDAVYSYHVVRLRLFQDWDIKFRNYIFKTRYFLNQCETICEGSGTRYVITLKKFRKLKIKYPKDPKEQSAISQLLYDIDLEIKELQKIKNKYIMIKNGMMQKLLTGEIKIT